jgi:A/G-specific adenine glycosylase
MTRIEIQRLQKRLIKWFDQHQRKLPWRETKDPFFIWVSEVMLQQTQVKKVLEYYDKFRAKFPDVFTLASADLQEVLKAWEGMGYYARARNLHQAAKIVAAERDGNFPAKYDEFRKLPGVGDYIAAAVLSQAFNAPHAVVDGNVKRVLSRLFLIESPVNHSSARKIFQDHANEILDQRQSGIFNQAMMELGATICRPQKPNCQDCPISPFCLAYRHDRQRDFPVTIQSRPIPEYPIVVGIVQNNGCVLITQRKTDGLLGGLWEFPGGRKNSDETPEQACTRTIKEKLALEVEITGFVTRIHHAYSHFKIKVDVFQCNYQSGAVNLNGPQDYRWISIDEIDRFPFHAASRKITTLLKDRQMK